MSKEMKPKLKDLGYHFPTVYLGVMSDLWKKDGVSQKQLGMSVIKTKSSINKMLLGLEQEGLIYRKSQDSDQRFKLIFLTEKGRELKNQIQSASKTIEQDILQYVPTEELEICKSVLNTIHTKLTEKTIND